MNTHLFFGMGINVFSYIHWKQFKDISFIHSGYARTLLSPGNHGDIVCTSLETTVHSLGKINR